MKKKIFVDYKKCTGCNLCALACSLVKNGTCNPVRSRIRVADWKEKGLIVPIICQDCKEPVCLPCCPEVAISKDGETGIVMINKDLCTNCRMCIRICPYGGPSFDPVGKEVVLCDNCEGSPACVGVCSRGAIVYVEIDDSLERIRLESIGEMRRTMVNLIGV